MMVMVMLYFQDIGGPARRNSRVGGEGQVLEIVKIVTYIVMAVLQSFIKIKGRQREIIGITNTAIIVL